MLQFEQVLKEYRVTGTSKDCFLSFLDKIFLDKEIRQRLAGASQEGLTTAKKILAKVGKTEFSGLYFNLTSCGCTLESYETHKDNIIIIPKTNDLGKYFNKKNKQGESLVCLICLDKAIQLAKMPIVTLTNRLLAHQKRY